jgi:hypothetical protein
MTQIFNSYIDFLNREDKEINGVSKDFAELNSDFEKQNETNKGCWNCSYCSDCSYCSYCSKCSYLKNATPVSSEEEKRDAFPEIPVIENIHQKVFEAVSQPNALDMSTWHACETTHCRAGWVVTLAGEQGKVLESKTSPLFAAMQIYKKSSEIKVSPTRFFESNKVALRDMQKCAEMEAKGEVV